MKNDPTVTPTDPPIDPTPHGASDATLWILLAGITFMLLLCVLFVLAASR